MKKIVIKIKDTTEKDTFPIPLEERSLGSTLTVTRGKEVLGVYPICNYCGKPVISPAKLQNHLSCEALEKGGEVIELDTKDIII